MELKSEHDIIIANQLIILVALAELLKGGLPSANVRQILLDHINLIKETVFKDKEN